MFLIVGGPLERRHALQHVLKGGPVPTSICASIAEVDRASRTGSEPITLVIYDVEVIAEKDLAFIREVRARRYERIRSDVPIVVSVSYTHLRAHET